MTGLLVREIRVAWTSVVTRQEIIRYGHTRFVVEAVASVNGLDEGGGGGGESEGLPNAWPQ